MIEILMAASILVWIGVAHRDASVLEQPRKRWRDDVSQRWFRFHFCFKVATRCRLRSAGFKFQPLRSPDRRSLMQWVSEIVSFDMETSSTCLVAGGMLCMV